MKTFSDGRMYEVTHKIMFTEAFKAQASKNYEGQLVFFFASKLIFCEYVVCQSVPP